MFAAFAVAFATDDAAQEDSLESLGIFVKNAAGNAATPSSEEFNPLHELSETNFSDFVSSSSAVLVELCGKGLAPAHDRLASHGLRLEAPTPPRPSSLPPQLCSVVFHLQEH